MEAFLRKHDLFVNDCYGLPGLVGTFRRSFSNYIVGVAPIKPLRGF